MLRAPQSARDRVRRRNRHNNAPLCYPLREARFMKCNRPLLTQRRNRSRIHRPRNGRSRPVLKPRHSVRKNVDVAVTAPLTIGDIVKASRFLHSDHRGNDIIKRPIRIHRIHRTAQALFDKFSNPYGSRQTTNNQRAERPTYGLSPASWSQCITMPPSTLNDMPVM